MEYNLRDGLSVQLHEYSCKRLGFDWNSMDTDKSNFLLELCDEVVDIMHDELRDRLNNFEEAWNEQ